MLCEIADAPEQPESGVEGGGLGHDRPITEEDVLSCARLCKKSIEPGCKELSVGKGIFE